MKRYCIMFLYLLLLLLYSPLMYAEPLNYTRYTLSFTGLGYEAYIYINNNLALISRNKNVSELINGWLHDGENDIEIHLTKIDSTEIEFAVDFYTNEDKKRIFSIKNRDKVIVKFILPEIKIGTKWNWETGNIIYTITKDDKEMIFKALEELYILFKNQQYLEASKRLRFMNEDRAKAYNKSINNIVLYFADLYEEKLRGKQLLPFDKSELSILSGLKDAKTVRVIPLKGAIYPVETENGGSGFFDSLALTKRNNEWFIVK